MADAITIANLCVASSICELPILLKSRIFTLFQQTFLPGAGCPTQRGFRCVGDIGVGRILDTCLTFTVDGNLDISALPPHPTHSQKARMYGAPGAMTLAMSSILKGQDFQ